MLKEFWIIPIRIRNLEKVVADICQRMDVSSKNLYDAYQPKQIYHLVPVEKLVKNSSFTNTIPKPVNNVRPEILHNELNSKNEE